MEGGVNLEYLATRMPKTKFLFMLKTLREQLKKENDVITKKSSFSTKKPSSGKMKYLGR